MMRIADCAIWGRSASVANLYNVKPWVAVRRVDDLEADTTQNSSYVIDGIAHVNPENDVACTTSTVQLPIGKHTDCGSIVETGVEVTVEGHKLANLGEIGAHVRDRRFEPRSHLQEAKGLRHRCRSFQEKRRQRGLHDLLSGRSPHPSRAQRHDLDRMTRRSTAALLVAVAVAVVGSIGIALGAAGRLNDAPSRSVSAEELRTARPRVEHAAARQIGSDFACVTVDQHRMKIFLTEAPERARRRRSSRIPCRLRHRSTSNWPPLGSATQRWSQSRTRSAVPCPRIGENASIAVSSPQSQTSRCTPVEVAFYGGGVVRKRWQRNMVRRYGADRVHFIRSELIVPTN